MSDANEDTQPEEQAPVQQSAQDTTPWVDESVYTPDGSRNIRAEDEAEQAPLPVEGLFFGKCVNAQVCSIFVRE